MISLLVALIPLFILFNKFKTYERNKLKKTILSNIISLSLHQDNLLLDMYLAPHVKTLYSQIRNRALIQVSEQPPTRCGNTELLLH